MVKVQGASIIIVIVLTVTISAEASPSDTHQWSPEEVDQTTLGNFL